MPCTGRRQLAALLSATLLATSLALVGAPDPGAALPPASEPSLPTARFELAGRYDTGGGAATAEISAYDDETLYVTNGFGIDVVDASDPANPVETGFLNTAAAGLAEPTSVAARHGLVAVAVPNVTKTSAGVLQVFVDGRKVDTVPVGALPDMVTFSASGGQLLVANEGEPNSYGQPDSVDPVGSVSLVPTVPYLLHGKVPPKVASAFQKLMKAVFPARAAGFEKFNEGQPRHAELPEDVRIFGPGATVAQDLEPEYITSDHRNAYVTLQENNAIATVDLVRARVTSIASLGSKDHAEPGAGLDASDRDDGINVQPWPVRGLYMPDAIGSYRAGGATYLVTANEGDARDYDGFGEEERAKDVSDLPETDDNAALGRLTVTTAPPAGDTANLYAFGARSFSIWSADGELVFDSGDEIERIVAATNPEWFNSTNDADTFDDRSDNKGPEPEGIAVGAIDGRTYAFVGLERVGGVMVFDITNPTDAVFQQYLTTRVFGTGTLGPDSGPEGLVFIPAADSPTGRAMLAVSHELTGTVALFEAQASLDGAGTLTLLHNNDGESTIEPLTVGSGETAVQTAGVAAYKQVVDREIADARNRGNAVLNVYAGDAFLASSTLACSLPPNPDDTPVYDAVAQRQMTYDTHVFGNHEFDFGPSFLERFVRGFTEDGVPAEPFLSANLDFSGTPSFADLLDGDGVIQREAAGGRVIARAAVLTDEATGLRVAVVGATTPALPTISSPGSVLLTTTDLASTAAVVQGEVDALTATGINKVILVSHLQNVQNDRDLVALLRDVDVAVAGGGDELLADPGDPLLPGSPAVAGTYPLNQLDADGQTVPIVTTEGNYKYVGRLDVEFDAAGEVVAIDDGASFPRRVIVDSAAAQAAGFSDAVTPDARVQSTAVAPVSACLAALADPIARTEVPINVSNPANAGLGFTTGVRSGETNGGNLVTDGYVAAYDTYAAAVGLPPRSASNPVVAVQNGGGIRQNAGSVLPVGTTFVGGTYTGLPGTISRRNTLDVMAFLTNSMTVVNDVTPAELKSILEWSAASLPTNGRFLQVGGFDVVYSTSGTAQVQSPAPSGEQAGDVITPGTRVVSVTLDDGTPIVAAGALVPGAPSVRVVTNSFTARGAEGYAAFEDTPASAQVNLGLTYEQALVEYLLSFPLAGGLPTIPAADPRYANPAGEGRITIIP
jgi:2',3'-cyclic-nucleotide 2'-phosphodiesterase / 3'-nucleotidase / 5'-nucleotidase